jgi:enoyl-[acyl-carrier-protein] reductase (NADH)
VRRQPTSTARDELHSRFSSKAVAGQPAEIHRQSATSERFLDLARAGVVALPTHADVLGATAKAFGREGATVHLAGRTHESLDKVAAEIRSAGGAAEVAVVDALDEKAVDEHANAVAAGAGGIDISMNVITHPHTHGIPMAEMDVDDFMAPVDTAARTTFIISMAAARLVARSASRLWRVRVVPGAC